MKRKKSHGVGLLEGRGGKRRKVQPGFKEKKDARAEKKKCKKMRGTTNPLGQKKNSPEQAKKIHGMGKAKACHPRVLKKKKPKKESGFPVI